MKHLILGGTGTVGGAVVRALLARGEAARVLTRSEESARALPAGAEGVVGDLNDPDCYERVFADFDALFLLNAVSSTELQEGLAAVNEARRAGAGRIVYLSVQNAEGAPHVPHFASKTAIETAIRASGVPFTILRPNNFYQNDYWFRTPVVEYGVYPQPLGAAGTSRVDVRDIAEVAVRVLTEPGFDGRTITLAGPRALTGEDCARDYAAALGREVRYAGDDLDAWAAQARQMLPGWMVYDFRLMYAHFQRHGLVATSAELAEMEALLGRPPRDFADFARETAAQWTGETAVA